MEDISPGAGEAVFNLACTGDLLSVIPVPEGVTEAVMVRVICKSLDLLNTEGREITGVSFDTPKTKVYIPSGLDPKLFDFGDRQVAIHHPRHEALLKRGLVHVGVPMGTTSMEEHYVTEFLLNNELQRSCRSFRYTPR